MSSRSSSSPTADPARPAATLVAAVALLGSLVGCSTVEVGEASSDGEVAVGDVQADVADVECADLGETLRAGGVAPLPDDREGRISTFDVTVEGESAQAVVRVLRGDEVVNQQVGTDLTAVVEGDDVTVSGSFTGFDGPTQTGEASGDLSFSCTEDRDPGGGSLSLDGQEIAYDLVTCLETDDLYEMRAWATESEADQVTMSRTRGASGWQDRVGVLGSISAENEGPANGTGAAVEASGGLFEVRGARVSAEGPAFGAERLGALEVTCGIDLSTTAD
jgi:hypothetical protein